MDFKEDLFFVIHVMSLNYGGVETHKTRLGQKIGLYYKKEMRDYGNPNVGTNQKILGTTECSRLQ